jgi:L-iditol 2-dehydrogenase
MDKTMVQQVMTAPGVIEFRNIPVPEPKAGQVLVKIKKIGVCGSDIHVYHGKHPFTKYPITQGHEVSAQIISLGEGVKGFEPGQKVTIEPQVYCGKCYPCTHGKYNLCEELKVMGFQTTGTASEIGTNPQSAPMRGLQKRGITCPFVQQMRRGV